MSACPKCGHQAADAEATTCPDCGHSLNGQGPPGAGAPVGLPSRPAGIPDGRLAAELDEWERQHFDGEAFVTGLREVERTGGLELQDFIHEIDQGVPPRE